MKRKGWRELLTVCGAAAITAVTLLTVYFAFHLYPFGSNSLSWCDMNQQVIPLLCDFKDILSGKGSLLLSFQNAGGMEFWGVFFFFLASPFSFLVIFIDKADMMLFMNILVLLKLCTAAATAAFFFRRVFAKLGFFAAVALASSYALCGFGLMYYQNVIWLDMLWSFPLLVLSMLRLAEKGKPLCFILMLSLSVVMNYYIGYMLVVFLLLASPLWIFLCTKKEERGRLSLLFLLSCLAAALLTAVVWLPSFLQYLASARGGDGLLASLSSGTLFGSYPTKLPLLFCTPLLFASLPFLTFKRKRRTLFVFSVFLLMGFASVLEPINKMWQTGNYQSFPLRYGYMIVFFGLILTALALSSAESTEKNSSPLCFIAGLGSVAALALALFLLVRSDLETLAHYTSHLWGDLPSFRLLLLCFLLSVFVGAWLVFFFVHGKLQKRLAAMLLCLFVCVTSLFNLSVYVGSAASGDASYREMTDLEGKAQSESFFRVKTQEKYFVVNALGSLGYNSLSHYTSLTDKNYLFAMKKLGYSSYWMEVNSNGGTVLTDAILCNRFTVQKKSGLALSGTPVYENGTYRLLENDSVLPAAVKLSSSPLVYEALFSGERCEVQDALYRLYSGSDDSVITRYTRFYTYGVDYSDDDGLYTFTLSGASSGRLRYEVEVNGKQALYFDAFKDLSTHLKEALNDSFTVSVNGRTVSQSYPSQSNNGLLFLGNFEDETVSIAVTVKKDAVASSFGVFAVDTEKVKSLSERVSGCDLAVSGERVTAQIEATSGEYLYVCLPYNEGYRATVNGKSVPVYCVNDCFIALPLGDGVNEICLSYRPRGMIIGLILSAIGLLFTFVFLLLLKKRPRLFEHAGMNKVSVIVHYGIGIAVTVAVYVFPVAVFLFC